MKLQNVLTRSTIRRHGPIGVDLGSSSIKMVQLARSGASPRLAELARWDLPPEARRSRERWIEETQRALQDLVACYRFRGADAVVSLGMDDLFVQNVRLPCVPEDELSKVVRWEAEEHLPYPCDEAEIRSLPAGTVRQDEHTKQEMILLAAHRSQLDRIIDVLDHAGLRPVAIDAEPCTLFRCYAPRIRRESDREHVSIFVHVGARATAVVTTRGDAILFAKYMPVGGEQFDESVGRHFDMPIDEANEFRYRVAESEGASSRTLLALAEAMRSPLETLTAELSLCLRYHSVTFRGQRPDRIVLSGGEATAWFADYLGQRLEIPCELSAPFQGIDCSERTPPPARAAQWAVAVGLAMKQIGP